MPVIEVSIQDLERLAKTSLPFEKLLNALGIMKTEIEEREGDRLVYEVSHDRADLFSAEGLGRAIGYIVGSRKPSTFNVGSSRTYVDISKAPSYRPYCFAGIVRNLSLDDEAIKQITQLQEKLHLSYARNRELVSIGFYDLKKVRLPIKYLAVKDAEYVPLGYDRAMKLSEVLISTEKGRQFSHLVRKGSYPLLIDSNGEILSFPPVLNSEFTKVTENTRDILIDVTGIEPYLMMKLLNVMITSIAERSENPLIETFTIVGGGDTPFTISPQLKGKFIAVSPRDVRALGGISTTASLMAKTLSLLGYLVDEVKEDSVKVWVPPYRIDVYGEADVIEDVLIGYGYDELKADITHPTHPGWKHPIELFTEVVRNLMIGLGFTEVVNFMMVDSEFIKSLTDEEFIEVSNPKIKTYSAIRNSLAISLLLTAKANYERSGAIRAFEIGDVVRILNGKPINERRLGILLVGEDYTLTDGLVAIKTLAKLLGEQPIWLNASSKPFIRGRTAIVKIKSFEVGVVGEVHPRILADLRIFKPTVIAELNLDKLRKAISVASPE